MILFIIINNCIIILSNVSRADKRNKEKRTYGITILLLSFLIVILQVIYVILSYNNLIILDS